MWIWEDEVVGADAGIYPPMSTVLAEAGVGVHEGYDPNRLASLKPDMVIVGNAMTRGNPEVEWLLDTRALPFTSLPAMLHDQVLRHRKNIVSIDLATRASAPGGHGRGALGLAARHGGTG